MTTGVTRPLAVYWLLPAAIFLFILPFAHSITLRWFSALLTVAVAARHWSHGASIPPLPCKAAIGFWVATLLWSLLWAADPAASFSELKVDVIYSLLMFAAFYALTQGERELEVCLSALAAGSAVISLLAIGYFASYGKWVPGYQNALGEFATCMITALPAIMLLALRNMPWSGRAIWVRVALPVMLLAGLLTLSRMFLAALLLMMLTGAALRARRRKLETRQIFLIIAGIVGAAAAAGVMLMAQRRGLRFADDLRPAIWEVAWHRIAEHPWTGTGYGRLLDGEIYQRAFPGASIWHPHNLLLCFAEQAGVFAALAVILLFIALGREYWRLYQSPTRLTSYVGIAGLVMLLGVLTKNMTDMFFVRECALMFWSVNGILLGYGRRAEQWAAAQGRGANA